VRRFLDRIAPHVRRGFGPARRRVVADRAARLAVGAAAALRFRVGVGPADAVLVVRLVRDGRRSVVMTFESAYRPLVRAIDGELPLWCEETEPTWPPDG
jgi:hypothetical protein